MLTLLPGFAHDTVAVKASGLVSGKDYDDILVPAIEEKLTDHASVRLWYEFGADFRGFSVAALWDDAKLGLFHLGDFSRVAIIADDTLMKGMAHALSWMIPCPVKVFGLAEQEVARKWLDDTNIE
jgi:hypothetical protein